jgi:hypothetical protein
MSSSSSSTLVEDQEPLAVRESLPIARRSPSATRLTVGLLVMLAVSAGFLGGVLIQKNQGSSTTTAATAGGFGALARQFGGAAGAAGAGGAGGGRGGFGGATTGQIKLIDGTNIYVVDAQGNTVKVSTTPSSTISAAQPTTITALKLGDNVVVRGATAADGTVTATSLTDNGAQTGP